MTRTEAERIAADRNKGCERGVSYRAAQAGHRNAYPHMTGKWYVVCDDNGYRRAVTW